ncbi:hypothetical protein AUJ65_04550 [Candidatus Micrarchaeota archaeon CG1_02_51_15]|nr:MAG: hypothetical protein AUJ65_04550 [Candidatus Micrarchaeota archaeon CG1_02_51_15]
MEKKVGESQRFILSNRDALELARLLCVFLNDFEGASVVLVPCGKSFYVCWDAAEREKKKALLGRLSTKQLRELSLRYAQTLDFWVGSADYAAKSKHEQNFRDSLLMVCSPLSNKKINAFLREKEVGKRAGKRGIQKKNA